MSIQLPPGLLAEWLAEARAEYEQPGMIAGFVADKAVEWCHERDMDTMAVREQAAADHELEMCCDAILQIIDVANVGFSGPAGILHTEEFSSWPAFAQMVSRQLRAARRPKPTSLKEQALIQWEQVERILREHNFPPAEFIHLALISIPD